MIQKNIKGKKIITIFGTTQIDTDYASKLANTIQADERILVDDFCDRSLPCDTYKNKVKYDAVIHFLSEEKAIQELLHKTDCIKVFYGSFYLIGEIMRVSRYMPFATR
ncbi:hypothetical protein H6768_06155 [Candidatus Peribacteria bacterium]|nr:hypothetical protein [Candidatus Peribacteria bacterium]